MLGLYVISGILAGVAGAATGWLLGAPAWAAAGLYVACGSLGLVLAALASLLAPGRGWSRSAVGSWPEGARRMRPAVKARAAIRASGG